jgi:hypothetical protein
MQDPNHDFPATPNMLPEVALSGHAAGRHFGNIGRSVAWAQA